MGASWSGTQRASSIRHRPAGGPGRSPPRRPRHGARRSGRRPGRPPRSRPAASLDRARQPSLGPPRPAPSPRSRPPRRSRCRRPTPARAPVSPWFPAHQSLLKHLGRPVHRYPSRPGSPFSAATCHRQPDRCRNERECQVEDEPLLPMVPIRFCAGGQSVTAPKQVTVDRHAFRARRAGDPRARAGLGGDRKPDLGRCAPAARWNRWASPADPPPPDPRQPAPRATGR
jgi:hypothetical protein